MHKRVCEQSVFVHLPVCGRLAARNKDKRRREVLSTRLRRGEEEQESASQDRSEGESELKCVMERERERVCKPSTRPVQAG